MLRRQDGWCRFFLENYGDIFGLSEHLMMITFSAERADIVFCSRLARKKMAHDKYIIAITAISGLIVLPGAVAQFLGASIHVLAALASIQMLGLLAFFITSLISFGFSVNAMTQKKWKKAVAHAGAAMLPVATWYLAALMNHPGWQAVMGI